jgi:hypothetical protein
MKTSDLETILRQPPKPRPPSDLREQLRTGAPGFRNDAVSFQLPRSPSWGSWLRRWWPALGPAAATLACAVVITVQQGEIRSLEAQIAALTPAPAGTEQDSVDTSHAAATAAAPNTSVQQAEEVERLGALTVKLQDELTRLQAIQKENAQLKSQLAARTATTLTAEEARALEAASEKASSTRCVNNLKQFGLAVRVWAIDNGNVTPPSIVCMSNELSTPKILVCPADKGREPAVDFNSFTAANCSYEYLAPSVPDGEEPNRVLSRCAIHGNIGLGDGSVQMEVAKTHPERLVSRDGKLYLGDPRTEPAPPSAGQGQQPGIDQEAQRRLMERYGLKPADLGTNN